MAPFLCGADGGAEAHKPGRAQPSRVVVSSHRLSPVTASTSLFGVAEGCGTSSVDAESQLGGCLNQPPRPLLSKDASRLFLEVASTPPLPRRGMGSSC